MTRTITVAPVRKSIRVGAPPERAFEIFTAGMGRWWPKAHSINASPIADIVIEPRANGRWFERGEDGSECQWGKVLAWEPPGRVLLAWQLSPAWAYDPDQITELEIRFLADDKGTRVELEHRVDGFGAAAPEMFETFDKPEAWQGLLALYAEEAG